MTECNIKLPGSQTVLNEALEKVQTHSAELVEKSLQNITTHLLLLCGLVILMSYLQFLWQNRRLYWYSWKTPGPIGLPYIGIGYKFVSRDISALLQVVYDIQVTYPKVAVAWFGPRLYYLPSKPEYIEKIFKSQAALNKAHVYQFTNDIGDGLLNLGDKVWKIHRRTINQAFNQKVLNTFQDIFLQKSEIFADVLQKEVGNKNIELYTLLSGCTMDMVCETALGVNMNVQISKEVEFVKAINKVLEITSIRTFHVWHQLRFTWKLYPLSREFDKALKDFEDFLRSVISNKRKDFALKSSRKNCSLQNDKALAVEALLQVVYDIQVTYPKVAVAWFGPRLYYLPSKPEYIEKIFKSQAALNKAHVYQFTNDIGDGLLNLGDKVWKIHRRTINQAFNQKVLNTFQDIFLQKSEIFADVLQKEVGNKNIELYTLLSGCTMDMVCETALGVNMNVQISKEVEFVKAINKVLEITSIRTFHVWHQLRFTWKLYPLSREFDKALKDFEDFLHSVISNKRKDFALKSSRKNCSLQNDKALAVEEEPRIAFLDLIDNDNFTERELLDEIKTFFLAAVDTTASTLCSLFAMLGMHPDIQQKVFEEAVDILGPDRRSFPEDIQKMTYLERVLKETLRLFPGIPLLGRRLVEDIDGGDMVFPKGCSIIVGSVFLGRNPAYWPDPLKFDPDRFLPENIAKRHPCAYLPFSYGPRNCIGGKYGMINMKTIVATIIRRFKIFTEYKSVEEIKLSTYLILRLRDGPKVWLEPR